MNVGSLFSYLSPLKVFGSRRVSVERYITLRRRFKELEELANKDPSYKEHLQELAERIMEIEEEFYDVSKGLFLGVAGDLERFDEDLFLLYLDWNKLGNHFVVYGTSGYGKSRLFAIIMRQIIAKGWSLFAVDPKGGEKKEIASWMYEYALKYKRNASVMRITASFPNESDKLNPIFGMEDEEIASLCYSLTTTGVGVESADEKFFSGQLYRIVMAILSGTRFLENAAYAEDPDLLAQQIHHEVLRYKAFKDGERLHEDEEIRLPDTAQIILMRKKENKKLEINPFNRTLITFKEIAYYAQQSNLKELYELVEAFPVPTIDDPDLLHELKVLKNTAVSYLKPLVEMDKSRYESVGDTLSVLMSQLAFGSIGKIFCDVRINPLRFKLHKDEAIVLFEPAPMRFEKVSEMMMRIFTKMFLSLFGEIGASGKGLKRRVALMIDEAKPMIYPGIDELYNKSRQLGMTIGAFFQSKSDPKSKVGEVLADIIEDNTATQIFMKQVSSTSQEEIAKSFGTMKFALNVHMGEVDLPDGRNTVVYEDRPLVMPAHIDNLQVGEAFVRHYGKKYFVKFPFQKDAQNILDIEFSALESEILFEELKRAEEKIEAQLRMREKFFVGERL